MILRDFPLILNRCLLHRNLVSQISGIAFCFKEWEIPKKMHTNQFHTAKHHS